ncbi:thiol oxidoreductase, partial [Rhodovulum sulfidophilum]
LARALEPQAGYLHDGRARTLLEAVLWHGGEAAPARDRVATMPASDRAALIRFLESL